MIYEETLQVKKKYKNEWNGFSGEFIYLGPPNIEALCEPKRSRDGKGAAITANLDAEMWLLCHFREVYLPNRT